MESDTRAHRAGLRAGRLAALRGLEFEEVAARKARAYATQQGVGLTPRGWVGLVYTYAMGFEGGYGYAIEETGDRERWVRHCARAREYLAGLRWI